MRFSSGKRDISYKIVSRFCQLLYEKFSQIPMKYLYSEKTHRNLQYGIIILFQKFSVSEIYCKQVKTIKWENFGKLDEQFFG